jgi:thioesterase domain-containing protein
MPEPYLAELRDVLDRGIPLLRQMDCEVESFHAGSLAMSAPLAPNTNHQQTAFAGSLFSLCAVTGWGSVFLVVRSHSLAGDIVIRRAAIRYLRPIVAPRFVARSRAILERDCDHFVEMLREKGQAKLDVRVEIEEGHESAVVFSGSYVASVRDRRELQTGPLTAPNPP